MDRAHRCEPVMAGRFRVDLGDSKAGITRTGPDPERRKIALNGRADSSGLRQRCDLGIASFGRLYPALLSILG